MTRLLSTVLAVAALALTGGISGAAPTSNPVPACPELEGWSHSGQPGVIDSGTHLQLSCAYMQPGRAEQPSYDAFWYTPAARDVDMNYADCGRAASGGSYYRDIWSKTHFVNIEYRVSGAVSGATNSAVFQAERERLDRTALALMGRTEAVAKSCMKTVPKAVDTIRPTVKVRPAGRRGVGGGYRARRGSHHRRLEHDEEARPGEGAGCKTGLHGGHPCKERRQPLVVHHGDGRCRQQSDRLHIPRRQLTLSPRGGVR